MDRDDIVGATGLLLWLIGLFALIFFLSHWDQINHKLEQLLGLG